VGGGVREYIEHLTQNNIEEDDFDIYNGRPLWQFHLIEGADDYVHSAEGDVSTFVNPANKTASSSAFEKISSPFKGSSGSGGGKKKSVVLLRFHHTLADGFRLAMVGSKLFSDAKGVEIDFTENTQRKQKRADANASASPSDGGVAGGEKNKPGFFTKIFSSVFKLVAKFSWIVLHVLYCKLVVFRDCVFLPFQSVNTFRNARSWSDADKGLRKRTYLHSPPLSLDVVK